MKKPKPTPLQRDVAFVLDVARDLPFMRRFLRRLVREAVTRARYQDGKSNYLLTHERIAKELVP